LSFVPSASRSNDPPIELIRDADSYSSYNNRSNSLYSEPQFILPSPPRASETAADNTVMPTLTEEQGRRLLDSLSFDQIDTRHASIKRAHIKTCKWLLSRSEYQDWLDPEKFSSNHGFLWIKGKPGSGKSTLMKFAFTKAKKTMDGTII